MEKECERVLLSETDINVKRNAFVLIFDLNQEIAFRFVDENLQDDDGTTGKEIGDILELAIVELLRKTFKIAKAELLPGCSIIKTKLMKVL